MADLACLSLHYDGGVTGPTLSGAVILCARLQYHLLKFGPAAPPSWWRVGRAKFEWRGRWHTNMLLRVADCLEQPWITTHLISESAQKEPSNILTSVTTRVTTYPHNAQAASDAEQNHSKWAMGQTKNVNRCKYLLYMLLTLCTCYRELCWALWDRCNNPQALQCL